MSKMKAKILGDKSLYDGVCSVGELVMKEDTSKLPYSKQNYQPRLGKEKINSKANER